MTDAAAPQSSPHPPEPLAAGPLGMRLLSFHREPENARPADVRVSYALVAVRHRGRLLLAHVRERACWELPGGGVEKGESPRDAAVRELREETGLLLRPDELRFVGFCRTALGPEQRVLYGALFAAELSAPPQPFTGNAEISAVHWRAGEEPPPWGRLQTVDTYLAGLCDG